MQILVQWSNEIADYVIPLDMNYSNYKSPKVPLNSK
jgi:hypothetical protein